MRTEKGARRRWEEEEDDEDPPGFGGGGGGGGGRGWIVSGIDGKDSDEAIVEVDRDAPAQGINGGQRSGLGLPPQHAGPVVGQRSRGVGEDPVGRVGPKAGSVVRGGIVRDDAELLPLGDEEKVVPHPLHLSSPWTGVAGPRNPERDQVGEPAVDGDREEEGEGGTGSRLVGGGGGVRCGGGGELADLEAAGLRDGEVLRGFRWRIREEEGERREEGEERGGGVWGEQWSRPHIIAPFSRRSRAEGRRSISPG